MAIPSLDAANIRGINDAHTRKDQQQGKGLRGRRIRVLGGGFFRDDDPVSLRAHPRRYHFNNVDDAAQRHPTGLWSPSGPAEYHHQQRGGPHQLPHRCLQHQLHARGRGTHSLLVPVPVLHRKHASAGNGKQPGHDHDRLGRSRYLQLRLDRVLLQGQEGTMAGRTATDRDVPTEPRWHEGVRGHRHRRRADPGGHLHTVLLRGHVQLC